MLSASTVSGGSAAIAHPASLQDSRRSYKEARNHAETMASMAKTMEKPEQPDTLSYTEFQTQQMLADTRYCLQQLQQGLGQCQGRMEALGDAAALQQLVHHFVRGKGA